MGLCVILITREILAIFLSIGMFTVQTFLLHQNFGHALILVCLLSFCLLPKADLHWTRFSSDFNQPGYLTSMNCDGHASATQAHVNEGMDSAPTSFGLV